MFQLYGLAKLQYCLPVSMQVLSSAAAFQLRLYPMASSKTVLVLRMPCNPALWLLAEVSQPELLQPNLQGLPAVRRCTELGLILKSKRKFILISHSWISSSCKTSEGC